MQIQASLARATHLLKTLVLLLSLVAMGCSRQAEVAAPPPKAQTPLQLSDLSFRRVSPAPLFDVAQLQDPAADVLVAVGWEGEVVRSADAGKTWQTVRPSDGTGTLFRVIGVPGQPKTLLAVGESMLRSTDAGLTWQPPANNGLPTLNQALAVPGQDGTLVGLTSSDYCSNAGGSIERSTDGGQHWELYEPRGWPRNWTRIVPLPAKPGVMLALGADGQIARTEDGGKAWKIVAQFEDKPGLFAAAALSGEPDTVVAVGKHGTVVRSTDAGLSWARAELDKADQMLCAIASSAAKPGVVVAAGMDGLILRSVDSGAHWEVSQRAGERQTGSIRHILAGAGQPHEWLAVGSSEVVRRSNDDGLSWSVDVFEPRSAALRPPPASDGRWWALGQGGDIRQSSDMGRTWTSLRVGGPAGQLEDATPVPGEAGTVIAAGLGSRLIRSSDAGLTWQPVGPDVAETQRVLALQDKPGHLLALSGSDILYSIDAGRSWSASTLPKQNRQAFLDITAVPGEPGHYVAVGQNYAVLHSEDHGRTWQFTRSPATDTPVDMSLLQVLPVPFEKSTLIAIGYGSALRSTDGGRNWSGIDEAEGCWNVTSLPTRPATLVAACGQQMMRSSDAGVSWQRIEVSADMRSIAAVPNEPQALVAAGESGGIQRSADAGLTWQQVEPSQDGLGVQRVQSLPGWPNALLALGERGALLLSVDGGRTWKAQRTNTSGALLAATLLPGPPRSLLVFGRPGVILRAELEP